MSYNAIETLEPREFFFWFCAVSRIPRDSRKEHQLCAFLEQFAAQRGIPCSRDAKGNLFMTVAATVGYENEPAILFQAHMDMVCRKDDGVTHDFEKDPIDLYIDGDTVRARGTTSGADNAVGLATMLALADGDDIPHPPLELLFTVEEEIGMKGIRAFDMSRIRARRMINMDCGDSHVLCVSSSGRISGQIRKTFEVSPLPAGFSALQLVLSGGKGGHSGLCANMGRACAANNLGDLLSSPDAVPFRLVSLCGQEAIMKSARAVIAVPDAAAASEHLQREFEKLRTVYARTDPDLHLEITPCAAESALGEDDSRSIAAVLSILRTGQHRADGAEHSTILSSGAITEVNLERGEFALDYGVRSTIDAEQELVYRRYAAIVKQFGMELQTVGHYSGWPEKPDSPFRAKFQRVHTRLFGSEMALERASGGIETCIVTAQIPQMDAVGIAPTARGAHTTGEHLFISETAPYWELLKAVLAEKEG